MSVITGTQNRDVALLGQIAQEVAEYFVMIGRPEEAAEEYEEALAAYHSIAQESSEFEAVRKLRETARERLNELKSPGTRQTPAQDSSSLSETIRDIGKSLNISEWGEALKDMLFPSIQWNLSFCMGDDHEEDEAVVTLPGMIRISGERKGNIVTLIIGSETIPEDARQISPESLRKFLERLNSCEEEFYCQILINRPDEGPRLWPDEPEEMRDLDIPVPDDLPDMFLVLLDPDEDNLRQNAAVIAESIGKPDNIPEKKASPSTLAMIVDIRAV